MDMRSQHGIMRGLIGAVAVAGLLLSTGCATTYYQKGEASQLIGQGEKVSHEARALNAESIAKAELKEAEEKLSKARIAFGQEWFEQAGRLAEEGLAAAEYAHAKAVSEKARMDAEEVRRNLEVLRREIEQQQSPSK